MSKGPVKGFLSTQKKVHFATPYAIAYTLFALQCVSGWNYAFPSSPPLAIGSWQVKLKTFHAVCSGREAKAVVMDKHMTGRFASDNRELSQMFEPQVRGVPH